MIEFLWTVIPFFIILGFAVPSMIALYSLTTTPPAVSVAHPAIDPKVKEILKLTIKLHQKELLNRDDEYALLRFTCGLVPGFERLSSSLVVVGHQ